MPTVPKAPIGQVRVAALPGPRQSGLGADAFGAGLVRGMQDAAGSLDRIALDIKAKDDEAAAKDIDVRFNRELRNMLYNADDAYYNRKGKTALDTRESTMEAVGALREKYLGMAGNPTQRALIDRALTARSESAYNNISSYAMREREVYFDGLTDARIADAIEDSAANYNDQVALARNGRVIEDEVAQLQERKGWSPEEAAGALEKQRTLLHLAVIDRMAVHNPGGALAYFNKHKDQIDGTKHGDVLRPLRERTELQAAHAWTDAQFASGASFAQMREQARKYTGPAREKRLTLIARRQAEVEDAKDKRAEQAAESAWGRVLDTGTPATVEDLQAEGIWYALDAADKKGIRSWLAAAREKKAVQTDPATYFAVMDGIEDNSIKTPAQLLRYRTGLSTTDLKAAREMLTGKGAVEEKTLREVYLKYSGEERWQDVMDSDDARADYVAFTRYVRDRVESDKRNDWGTLEQHAIRWRASGYAEDQKNDLIKNGPRTFGEAYREGETGSFLLETPDDDRAMADNVRVIVGDPLNTADRDRFYSAEYVPAVEIARRQRVMVTPENLAVIIQRLRQRNEQIERERELNRTMAGEE